MQLQVTSITKKVKPVIPENTNTKIENYRYTYDMGYILTTIVKCSSGRSCLCVVQLGGVNLYWIFFANNCGVSVGCLCALWAQG